MRLITREYGIPPANNEGEGNKGSVNSDTDLKINVTMAMSGVFFVAILAMIIVLAGMMIILIKLYKTRPTKQSASTSRYREEENPLFEYESTEMELKDNDF